ncbi:response regulator [Candidatus Sumerlaeota bacterium]|nr:response regulator [Candidatus Sumerlaeota bacterium]
MTAQTSGSTGMWRILCIDDDQDVLDILQAILSSKHEVVVAPDGVTAVGMLDFCDADFIICDIRMPKMDGFQTVELIRQHPQYAIIPVFFLTAEHHRDMAKRGFEVGANLYLTKPFDPNRLLSNIDYFLNETGQNPRPKRLTPDGVQAEAARRPTTQPVAKAAGTAAGAPGGRPRIVVISRVQEQLRLACAALESKYECVACADPLSSLGQLFRYEPDILLINPAVPKLSGWGLVQMLKQNPKIKDVSILVMRDAGQTIDERLIPTITDLRPLAPDATSSDIAAAVESAVAAPSFRIREKRSSLAELAREEERMRTEIETERARQRVHERKIKDRYRRIQDFIDSNLG